MDLRVAVFIICLTISGVSFAQEIDCNNASNTNELNHCAEKTFQKTNSELNNIIVKILVQIAKSDNPTPFTSKNWEKSFKEAQQSWNNYRDFDCEVLTRMEWAGGSGTTLATLGCMTLKTEQRIKDLKSRYNLK